METINSTDYDGVLQAYVEGCVADLIYDECPPSFRGRQFRVEHVSSDTDDGCAFGTFDIIVDGGIVSIRVEVSGYYSYEQDRWEWSSESHYTTTEHYADGQLDNLEMKVTRVLFADHSIDAVIENDIDAATEDKLEKYKDF